MFFDAGLKKSTGKNKPKVLFDAKKRSKRTGPKVVSVTFQY
jgi:hypothetical protein